MLGPGEAQPPSRANFNPSRVGTEQVKDYYCSLGSALGCLHNEGCQCGPGAMVVVLHPMQPLRMVEAAP